MQGCYQWTFKGVFCFCFFKPRPSLFWSSSYCFCLIWFHPNNSPSEQGAFFWFGLIPMNSPTRRKIYWWYKFGSFLIPVIVIKWTNQLASDDVWVQAEKGAMLKMQALQSMRQSSHDTWAGIFLQFRFILGTTNLIHVLSFLNEDKSKIFGILKCEKVGPNPEFSNPMSSSQPPLEELSLATSSVLSP